MSKKEKRKNKKLSIKIKGEFNKMQNNLFLKKWWFILVVVMLTISVVGCTANKTGELEQNATTISEQASEINSEQNIETTKKTSKPKSTKKEKSSKKSASGLSSNFKKAMDSYEKFMNEYCEFMKKYAKSDKTDLDLLSEYSDYMSKYAEAVKDFESWNDKELTTDEAAYYLDVQTRINKKLLEVSE